jgi:hypothetical protein
MHLEMTTIQFILLLCILVATVGLVIYFETKAAQDNDSPVKIIEEKPLTNENVIKVLTRFGATEIEEDNDMIAFTYQDTCF